MIYSFQKFLNNIKSSNNNLVPNDEISLTPTDDNQLVNFGINCSQYNISIDLFIAAQKFIVNTIFYKEKNLLTLNRLCDYSNGHLYFYKDYRIHTHYKSLYNQILRTITKFNGFEVVMRTRISKGVKCTNYITPVLVSKEDLINMPSIDR